jgi:hypothetical protein
MNGDGRRPGMSRIRLTSVLVGLAMIVTAAVGYRLSQQPDNFQIIRGTVGALSRYNEGSAEVSNVAVATELVNGTARVKTTGLFVVVRVTVQAPRSDEVHIQNAELLSTNARYTTFGLGSTVFAEPGFETTRDLAFEVAPSRIEDLTLEAWDTKIVTGYHQRLRVHLGITADNAAAWVAAAQGQRLRLDPDETTKGLA